jgi:hypothetical protein
MAVIFFMVGGDTNHGGKLVETPITAINTNQGSKSPLAPAGTHVILKL